MRRILISWSRSSEVDTVVVTETAGKLIHRVACVGFSTATFLFLIILCQLIEHAHLVHGRIVEVANHEQPMVIKVQVLVVRLLLRALVVQRTRQFELDVFLRLSAEALIRNRRRELLRYFTLVTEIGRAGLLTIGIAILVTICDTRFLLTLILILQVRAIFEYVRIQIEDTSFRSLFALLHLMFLL